jgi:expansin (peptidoglycan-binding protein)
VKATTSTHVIPTSTSSKATSTHSTSSTHKATTTTTSTSATSTSTGGVETGGVATFFYQNGVAGACGTVHSDSDLIAAMDQTRYGNSGEVSALCGQQVEITNTQNGKTVTVTIADDCPTCENANSIDLSVGAFTQIATEEQGEVPITWKLL